MRSLLVLALGLAGLMLCSTGANAQTDLERFKSEGATQMTGSELRVLHSDTTFSGRFKPLFGNEANVEFEAYNATDGERVFRFQGRTQMIKWWMNDANFCHTGYSTRSIPCEWLFYRRGSEIRMFHPDGSLHAAFNVTAGDPGGLRSQ